MQGVAGSSFSMGLPHDKITLSPIPHDLYKYIHMPTATPEER